MKLLQKLMFSWVKHSEISLHSPTGLSCSVVSDFVTLWTVGSQAPLFMRFSRQEYRRELPFPLPGYLPDSGIESVSPASPALTGELFTTLPLAPPGKLDSPRGPSPNDFNFKPKIKALKILRKRTRELSMKAHSIFLLYFFRAGLLKFFPYVEFFYPLDCVLHLKKWERTLDSWNCRDGIRGSFLSFHHSPSSCFTLNVPLSDLTSTNGLADGLSPHWTASLRRAGVSLFTTASQLLEYGLACDWHLGNMNRVDEAGKVQAERKASFKKSWVGWDELGDWDWHIRTIGAGYKIDHYWEPTVQQRELDSVLCGDLNGKENQK